MTRNKDTNNVTLVSEVLSSLVKKVEDKVREVVNVVKKVVEKVREVRQVVYCMYDDRKIKYQFVFPKCVSQTLTNNPMDNRVYLFYVCTSF
jgi:hypothetical protein